MITSLRMRATLGLLSWVTISALGKSRLISCSTAFSSAPSYREISASVKGSWLTTRLEISAKP